MISTLIAIVFSFCLGPPMSGEQGSVVTGEQGSASLFESGVVHPW